jgi:multiple sugar transport system substrate-binding protein
MHEGGPLPRSRRAFLRNVLAALGATTAASLLAACGPSGAPSGGAVAPTSPAAAAPKPTTAPAAAATTAPAAAKPAGAATPTAAPAASIANPTATPYPVANFGSNAAKVSIRYWTILGSVDGIIMNDLVRKFAEANPDIRVESLQGVTDFVTKMEAAAISNTAPDVAIVRHTYIGPFASKNVLSEITASELEQGGIKAEDFDPTVWKFSQFEGKQYTVPLDIHAHALLYNKAILSKGGFSKPPTTLEEWKAINDKVTSEDILGYNTFAIGNGAQEFMTWYWYGIVRQFGVETLTPDNKKAAFNTPEAVKAVSWMRDMQLKGNPRMVPAGDLQRTGRVATWADGPWISTLYFDKTKAAAADDIDVAPLPQNDPNKKATWAQSHQFALPRQRNPDPAKREASFRFIKWMGEHSVDWAKAGQVPARNSARQEALTADDPYLKKLQTWASMLPYAAYMPTSPRLLEVLPRIAANVEGSLLNQWSVEEGLKKAETEVNQILSAG